MRKIFIIGKDENGNRVEWDYDSLSDEEKKLLGQRLNRRALQAAGFAPAAPTAENRIHFLSKQKGYT